MKVFIATITTNYDGNVEVGVKPFSTFEKAATYLHTEYLDIKLDFETSPWFSSYGQDYVNNLTDDSSEDFYIETDSETHWCSGVIYGMEIE